MPPTRDKSRIRWLRVIVGLVCFFAVLATLLLVRIQPPRAAQSIQVITSDWEPYVQTDDARGGVVGDIVVSVLAGTGYNAQISFDTWSGGLNKVDQGTAFGIFPMVKSAERKETFEYSDPLVEFKYVLFKRRNDIVTSEVRNGNLSGSRVGKIAGYDYWPELDASGAQFVEYQSTIAGFEALLNGEIDYLAESDLVGMATLRGPEFEGDAGSFDIIDGDHPALDSIDSVHFLVRKGQLSRTFMDSFNASLAEYKKTDRYRQQVTSLSEAADRVVLVGDGLIDVTDASGASLGSIPSGVAARVLSWPNELQSQGTVEIKMLDGPLAGRIGRVPLANVEVRNGES